MADAAGVNVSSIPVRERSLLPGTPDVCDYCGSQDLEWVKCKLICRNCRQIVLSCADLREPPQG